MTVTISLRHQERRGERLFFLYVLLNCFDEFGSQKAGLGAQPPLHSWEEGWDVSLSLIITSTADQRYNNPETGPLSNMHAPKAGSRHHS